MANIKHLVSKKKKRYNKDGFDLDLSYITKNIIAMGYPSEGIEGKYRNNLKDVQKFFKFYHHDHFKVYNLCSERSYPPKIFGNSTAHYPFPDHNPPPFEMIMRFCKDCEDYLQRHEKNVVAIHCKAGKGRTGTLIVCLLMYLKLATNATDALELFARERTKNMKGVTIPSQKRYCYYFDWYLNEYYNVVPQLNFNLQGYPMVICGFRLKSPANFDVGGGCDPYFKVLNELNEKIYNSKKMGPKIKPWRHENEMILSNFRIPVKGDTRIIFYDYDKLSADDKMFQFWFHTSFVNEESLTFTRVELDGAHKDKKFNHFPIDFSCEIIFEFVPDNVDKKFKQPAPTFYDPKFGVKDIEHESDHESDDEYVDELLQYRWACEDNNIPPPPPPNDEDSDVPPPPPNEDDVPPPPPPKRKPPARPTN